MSRAALLLVFLAGIGLAPGAEAQLACLPPEEPYPYEPPRDDPELRDLVNEQYENYLTDVEDYLACLSEEHRRVLRASQDILQRWVRYFGDEAAIQYEQPEDAMPISPTSRAPDRAPGE